MLEKWHFYKIWCPELLPPHSKFCLCVSPEKRWFLFVNSSPAASRKARQFDVVLNNFQLAFLDHESYLPTAAIKTFYDDRVVEALKDPRNLLGPIPPSLKKQVLQLIANNPVLKDGEREMILDGESLG